MKGIIMKRLRQAALVSSALTGFAGAAQAQQAPAAPVGAPQEETATQADTGEAGSDIVVTGYAGSLRQALQVKRNANAVVDAISAEDIGKFPDRNVAE